MTDSDIESISLGAVAAQRWRNGAGMTRELLCSPSAANWRWRVSVADIDADAPFSAYPGVQRWFAVIDGAGVALRFADQQERVLTPADAPLCFDGGDAPACRLVGGPTRDLNLMLRGTNGGIEAADPGAPWSAQGDACGLFAAEAGDLALPDGRSRTVAAMSLQWLRTAPRGEMRFAPRDRRASAAPGRAWWLFVALPVTPPAPESRTGPRAAS